MHRWFAAFALVSVAAFAGGRGKIIDFKNMPTSVPGLQKLLKSPSKDQPFRTAAALFLDTLLRERGHEVLETAEIDQIFGEVMKGIFTNMVADTDVYTWEKDNWGPRGDIVCKEKVLVYPGRVGSTFERKYTVKVMGKRIDRGYLNQECSVTVAAAKTEAEWHEWTSQKGWGLNPHAVFAVDDVARIAVALYSPGNSMVQTPKPERPIYVGFADRAKEGAEWKLMSVEPMTSLDYRKQESNVFPADAKPGENEKKLRAAFWMEAVRVLNPTRETFIGTEALIFAWPVNGNDAIDGKDKWLLEPYRKSDSALVRASAELKLSKMGTATTPAALADLVAKVPAPAVKNELIKELMRLVGAKLDAAPAAAEEDKAKLQAIVSSDPKNPVGIKEAKIDGDWARVRVFGLKLDGYVLRKVDEAWQVVGTLR